MKRAGLTAIFVGIFVVVVAMAGGGGEVFKIPTPERNFKVVLVDQSDVSLSLERFSCEGKTYFLGKRGRVEVAVDFEKVDTVRFLLQDGALRGEFVLKNGSALSLLVPATRLCYGVTPYGNVRIELRDIKSVTVGGYKTEPRHQNPPVKDGGI